MAKFVDRVKKAEATVKKAKSDHVTAVSGAEKALKQAEGAYLASIKRIEKELDEVEKEYAQKISSFGGITLYRDHIKGSGKAFKLDSSVVAKVDIDGSIYASRAADGGQEISRIANTRQADGSSPTAVGDEAFSPADAETATEPAAEGMQDETAAEQPAPAAKSSKAKGAHARAEEGSSSQASTLYLTVESDYGRIGTQAKPEKLDDARNFTLQVSAVAAVAEASEREKEAKIETLRTKLVQAKAHTADIDQAKAFLASVEADNTAVVAAEQNLTSLMGNASRKDLVSLSEHQLKMKKRKKTVIIVALIVIVVAIAFIAIYLNWPK